MMLLLLFLYIYIYIYIYIDVTCYELMGADHVSCKAFLILDKQNVVWNPLFSLKFGTKILLSLRSVDARFIIATQPAVCVNSPFIQIIGYKRVCKCLHSVGYHCLWAVVNHVLWWHGLEQNEEIWIAKK